MESSFVFGASEKNLRVHPAHLLDTLAADSHRTLDERSAPAQWGTKYTQRRGTLCIETSGRADTLGCGFIDVSPTSADR